MTPLISNNYISTDALYSGNAMAHSFSWGNHRYVRREGSPGKWRYIYPEDLKKAGQKLVSGARNIATKVRTFRELVRSNGSQYTDKTSYHINRANQYSQLADRAASRGEKRYNQTSTQSQKYQTQLNRATSDLAVANAAFKLSDNDEAARIRLKEVYDEFSRIRGLLRDSNSRGESILNETQSVIDQNLSKEKVERELARIASYMYQRQLDNDPGVQWNRSSNIIDKGRIFLRYLMS